MYCFNPRTRESATHVAPPPRALVEVSIHALVRVRRVDPRLIVGNQSFNPRTRESATSVEVKMS